MSGAGTGTRDEATDAKPAFIDTLSPEYDWNIHAAHRAARAQGWYAQTPVGLAFLDHEDVLWLLSDAASYVTGALLDVSGGR